jgi:hypothetical protein
VVCDYYDSHAFVSSETRRSKRLLLHRVGGNPGKTYTWVGQRQWVFSVFDTMVKKYRSKKGKRIPYLVRQDRSYVEVIPYGYYYGSHKDPPIVKLIRSTDDVFDYFIN